MACANTGIYKFKSVVGGHHILNCINSINYKSLQMVRQDINECDEYTVTITKRDMLLLHASKWQAMDSSVQ